MEILKVEGLTVGYSGKKIVSDMSFKINSGEIVSVIGRNGAGKSTVLKSIAGTISPLSGDIYLNGKNVQSYTLTERAKIVASLFTEKIDADMMSSYDMIAMGRFPYTNTFGSLSDVDKKVIDEVTEITNTTNLLDKQFNKLSDGQRQRVLLARALCQSPKLLILDEPTSFLDIKYKLELLTLLRELACKMDFAVLLSLHELDMAKQVSDRLICLKDGFIDRIGTRETIFTDGYVKSLFDIKEGDFDENTGLGILNGL